MKAVYPLTPLAVLFCVSFVGGCQPRIKSVESFESTMTPNPKATGATLDPYTYGGTAMASGGTQPQTSFASYAAPAVNTGGSVGTNSNVLVLSQMPPTAKLVPARASAKTTKLAKAAPAKPAKK